MDSSKAHVIDSDVRVEEFIPGIYDVPETQPESFAFPQFDGDDGEEKMEEFDQGLSVISMKDVVSEEREKLERELLEEQENILNAARKEAEGIIEQANQEAESIRVFARNEGMEKGKAEGRAEAGLELMQRKQELEAEYDVRFQELMRQEENLEPEFAELVISLVRKLTGVVCENKRDIILYLLGNSLKNVERTERIGIRVSKADMSLVSAKKSTLKLIAGDISEFDIIEDESLSENQCIIETDNKVIDCSMDAQLQNLEEHIRMLSL